MEQQDQSEEVSSTIRRRICWWLRLPLAGFVICTVCLALFTELEIWGSLLWGGLAALTACLVWIMGVTGWMFLTGKDRL